MPQIEWQPEATIKILRFVPLDNTYQNTLYFESPEEQIEYFEQKTKFVDEFNNQSYTRHTLNKIRIEHNVEDLLDCNYLMFQNKPFGSQWFYAFITDIEYVNVYTSEITFEIDVMQTWYWNYALRECLVIREHSATDEIGDNLVAETIDTGNYICANTFKFYDEFKEYVILLATTQDFDGNLQVSKYSNLQQCCFYSAFSNEDGSRVPIDGSLDDKNLLDYLNAVANNNDWEGIINAVFVPRWAAESQFGSVLTTTEKTIQPLKGFGTYVPKNNKLLTFPYSFIQVETGGKSNVYRYEFFHNEATFKLTATLNALPTMALTPLNYNGQEENYSEEIILDTFPQANIAIDSFKAYIAQHGGELILGTLGSLVSVGFGLAAFAAAPLTGATVLNGASLAGLAGTAGGLLGFMNQVNKSTVAMTKPAESRVVGTSAIDISRRSLNFYFKQFQVMPEYAKIIDDYFTMFGYATNRLKIPNIFDKTKKRPHYNYVLLGNVINFSWYLTPKGTSVPQADMAKIRQVYNKGITFWNTDTEVGDYTVDNSPQN